MKRQILISSLILLSIQALAGAGNTYYVPSRDYPTIQSAINATAVANDDVVIVAPGVYTDSNNVDLDFGGKAITVRSQINLDNPNPAIIAATIIDCQGDGYNPHRAFRFHSGEGSDSKVLGFTIINGHSRGPKGADGTFGYYGYNLGYTLYDFDPVSVNPAADPNTLPPRALDGANASGNGYGGAILCEAGSSPTIRYCVITDCTVTGAQGGDGAVGQNGPWQHWTLGDADPFSPGRIAPDATITDNDDGQWGGHGGSGSGNGYGGAIACRGGSSPIISDCTISDNFARGGRGGNGGNGGNATEPPDYDQGDESGGGNAGDSIGDGMGGGIYADGSSPIITNCTFSNNVATTGARGTGGERGLGIETDPRTPKGFDSFVLPSTARSIAGGAAYYDTGSNANFTNCAFTGNKTYEAYVFYDPSFGEDVSAYTVGGALYSGANNTITLDTCKFTGNLGGAVYCDSGCNLNFDDCLFTGNSDIHDSTDEDDLLTLIGYPPRHDPGSGGAVYIDAGGTVDLQGCIFGGNSAKNDGGALKCRSNATLTNCSFGNNRANSDNDGSGYGGAMDAYEPGTTLTVNFNNCSFTANQATYGGGFSSENFDATFTNCYFIGNTALEGGGLDLVNGDVSVTGGVIKGNNATDGDGGGFNCRYTTAEIRDCTISDNFADGIYPTGGNGGAINFYGGASTQEVFNCLITGNKAAVDGGAIFCRYASPDIGNCTFSGNSADGYGGAIFSDFVSEPNITDCIFEGCNNHAIHEEDSGGDAIVTYSLFYDNPDGDYYDSGTGLTYTGAGEIGSIPGGSNNLYGAPLFVSGDLGDYYLSQIAACQGSDSPAINNGSDTAVNLGLDTYTTRTDNADDTGQVDIGYHYIDIADVDTFQLTASVIGGHGTIEPTSGTYYAGTVVTLTATPGSGWRVKAWSGTDNDSSTAKTNSVVMNSDRTVTVEFEPPKTLIVAVGGGEGYYSNIQAAIHDAEDGDTIVVYPGVYYGPAIQLNKSVEIRSKHPDDPTYVASTIIDRTGYANRAFAFEAGADGAILNGFTIQNCRWFVLDGDNAPRAGVNGEDGVGTQGAAIYIAPDLSPVIKNCVIRDNWIRGGHAGNGYNADEFHNAGRGGWGAWARGGAVYCGTNSSPTFINCQIIDNTALGGNGGNGGNWDPEFGTQANYGGNWSRAEWWNIHPEDQTVEWEPGDLWEVWHRTGIFGDQVWDAGPYFGDYRWYSGYGGAVFIDKGSDVTFIDCIISGNLAQGGMSGEGGERPGEDPEPEISYEIPSFGGGVYCAAEATVTFTGCTITDNIASEPNELNYHIDPYLGHGGGVCAEDTAAVIFTDCAFSGNQAAVGGGLHFANANPVISDCNFTFNSAFHGGGLFGEHGPATIIGCNIFNNEAVSDPNDPNVVILGEGGGLHLWATEADIIDCNISSNQAEASGGGVYFGGESAHSLTNCLLTENTAGRDGGGISANIFNQLAIFNCTIAGNIVTGIGFEYGYGGGLYCSHSSYTNIIDSILWGNFGQNGPQIAIGTGFEYDPLPSTVDVSYSNVQGERPLIFVDENCTLNWGVGNIYTDPLFVVGPLGDYYLSQIDVNDPCQTSDSPCVDAGSDLASNVDLHLYTTRTDEVPDRNIVDMGYHYPLRIELCSFSDLSNDGIVNFTDQAILVLYWLRDDCSADNDWCDGADLTFDGYVNSDDLDALFECWLAEDTEAPIPNPSRWEIEPYSTSMTPPYEVNMTAEAAFDNWGGVVEYYFECVTGNDSNSGWRTDRTYPRNNLDPDTVYGYRVRARDASEQIPDDGTGEPGNKTEWSVIRYAMVGAMAGEERNYYAVICGIADYQGVENDLPFPTNDAYSLYQILIESGNWEEGNITILLDSSATKAAIQSAIQTMASRLDSDDVFLFYFAGHGTAGPEIEPFDELDGYDEYLATYDLAEVGSEEYINFQDLLRDDELGDWLEELPTDDYIVILDSCFSGGTIDGFLVRGLGDNVPSRGDGFAEDLLRIAQGQSPIALTSCAEDEVSYETFELGHGVFTYYLLDAMYGRGDDEGNGNGWVSGEECYDYLVNRANSYMERFGVIDGQYGQHPQLYDADLANEFEFLLLEPVSPGTPAAPTILGALAVSSSQIDLSWTDNSNNEERFRIDRKTIGSMFEQIAAVGADETSYSDMWLVPETPYTYRIRAYNGAGDSAWSNEASAITLEAGEPPPPPDTTPPTPNPSQWAVGGEPMQYLSGVYYWHTMTAEPASDAENEPVEYYFELVAGGNGPTSSGWQLSNVYDYAVSSNPAQYGVYRVKTRDAADPPNETGWSEMRSTLE